MPGAAFFRAEDATGGQELWRSDGTAAGTRLAADIRPGTDSGAPKGLLNHQGKIYFNASNGTDGKELWIHKVIAEKVWTEIFD